MMNTVYSQSISKQTNEELLCELKFHVENERRLLMEILYLLREVETRKLHLELGFPDLYSFAMKELGYSSGAAYRRISAMRLLQAVPEIAPKLTSGELGLENASQAQSYFRKENQRRKESGEQKLSLDEKREVVTELLGKSTREGLRVLMERSPNVMIPSEKIRPLPEQKTLVQFVAGAELMQKLDELKELLAHQNFDGRMDVLIEKLADMALKKLKPAPKPAPTPAPGVTEGLELSDISLTESEVKSENKFLGTAASSSPKKRSRYIHAPERRKVLSRDQNGCTYKDAKTGRICQSRHGLQFDHIVPFSRGGENTAQNLTLRCGAHNRFRAERMNLSRP